jgi:hypothetical protein
MYPRSGRVAIKLVRLSLHYAKLTEGRLDPSSFRAGANARISWRTCTLQFSRLAYLVVPIQQPRSCRLIPADCQRLCVRTVSGTSISHQHCDLSTLDLPQSLLPPALRSSDAKSFTRPEQTRSWVRFERDCGSLIRSCMTRSCTRTTVAVACCQPVQPAD